VLSESLGWNIDKDLYWEIITIALGYIFGEIVTDIARADKKIEEQ